MTCKNCVTCARMAALGLTLAIAGQGAYAQGGQIIGSRINLNVEASNLSLESIPGHSSSQRIPFFSKKKESPPLVAVVELGVVEVQAGATLAGSDININVQLDGLHCRGCQFSAGKMVIRGR